MVKMVVGGQSLERGSMGAGAKKGRSREEIVVYHGILVGYILTHTEIRTIHGNITNRYLHDCARLGWWNN